MSQDLARMYELPCAGGTFFAAGSAVIVGDVSIGPGTNVWHHCTIRGDVAPIRIGPRVVIQDGSVLHCNYGIPLEIDEDVAIAHRAVVHCARIGPRTLVGMNATVLGDCDIGRDCIIGAGAVVPPGKVVPDGSVVMGVPAKVVRKITDDERAYTRYIIEHYQQTAREHAAGKWTPPYCTTPSSRA